LACHEKKLAQRITDNVYIFAEKECHLNNGFIERYCIKFLDKGDVFEHEDLFLHCGIKADGYYEALVEKNSLAEALGLLLSQGHEIYSVNPRHADTFGGAQNE
jgi:hypothetical protein